MSGRFDVAVALRHIVRVFWLDFAPILLLGFAMVTFPRLIGLVIEGTGASGTVLAVFSGLLFALYLTIVSHGTVARLAGRPLEPQAFVSEGIVASPPGFSVALLLGTCAVLLIIVGVVGGAGRPGVGVAALVAGLSGLVVVFPVVPVALVERLAPLVALRRAVALTRGKRLPIALVVAVVALALVPTALVLQALQAQPTAGHGLASPGLWLRELYNLLAWGVAAVVPGVVYAGLVEGRK